MNYTWDERTSSVVMFITVGIAIIVAVIGVVKNLREFKKKK